MATAEVQSPPPAPGTPPSNSDAAESPLQSRKKLGLIVTGAVLLGVGTLIYLNQPPAETPGQRLEKALALMNEPADRSQRRAKRIAEDLQEEDFRDPEFMGGTDFVLGIVAFRHAQTEEESVRDRFFEQAAAHLVDAEQSSLKDSYRPQWAYALGTSWHRLGLAARARPLLEEAFAHYESRRLDAAAQLVEISLDLQNPAELTRALQLSDTIISELPAGEAGQNALGPAQLRKAQILLALGRHSEANALLPTETSGTKQNLDLLIVRAQTMMAQQLPAGYREARQLLEPVAAASAQHQRLARQAAYLIGLCHEGLGETDLAIDVYERTARKYEDTHEGLAAELREADLLRQARRHEEALAAYRSTLAQVKVVEYFRNRWLPVSTFRQRIFDAWNDWVELERFSEALALAEMAPPLIPPIEAAELTARASQKRAEAFQVKVDALRIPHPPEQENQRQTYWRESARAFERLAQELQTTARYTSTLWVAADHFRQGGDALSTRRVLAEFLANEPRELLPLGLVRDGQAAMDLAMYDDALAQFERVLSEFPTDPSTFEAEYWLGLCHNERKEPAKAALAWKTVITSESLAPAANEWRLSLFALARHEFHTATGAWTDAAIPEDADQQAWSDQQFLNAATRLQEYLQRYPDSAEANEAGYLLAKAWQRLAEIPRQKLKAVEIENERRLLRQEMQDSLKQARQTLLQLQSRLIDARNHQGLTLLQNQLLRNTYFDLADVEFDLNEFPAAITRYATATNLYPGHPRVLTAYLQMAECNDRMGKTAEALSMLQQARVVLKRMPDEAFQSPSTNYRTRADWEKWLQWATQLHQNKDLVLP